MAKNVKAPEITFEEGMQKLEEIVEQMEARDLPLDDILEKYEQGMKLIEMCGEKLKAAEKKILLFTQSSSRKTEVREVEALEQLSSLKITSQTSTLEDGSQKPPSLF